MRTKGALTAVAAAMMLASSGTAAAADGPFVQPGESTKSSIGYCTLNWIYDGKGPLAGRVYAGTAAHCVGKVGDEVSLASGTLGTALFRIGDVAFIGGLPDDYGRDYAFIELDPAVYPKVRPSMKGHPEIPTGVSTFESAKRGDTVQFSGNGAGFHATQQTREQRTGLLNYSDGIEHLAIAAVSNGDSGGPIADVTDGNKALGIVNTVGLTVQSASLTVVNTGENGMDLEFMLRDAAGRGFPLFLRTATQGPPTRRARHRRR